LKHIEVVKATEVDVETFILNDFIHHAETRESGKNISKKALKHLAKKAGLAYTEDQIQFAKKIMAVYLEQRQE